MDEQLRMAPLRGALQLVDRVGMSARVRGRASGTLSEEVRPGVSVVIPDRDSPALLLRALESVYASHFGEALQVIVVANGCDKENYAAIVNAHPDVELVHRAQPLGFSSAVHLGLQSARYDWTLLMHSDVVVDRDAVGELTRFRGPQTFAIGAQILQRNGDNGRREETGFIDWYVDSRALRTFHAEPGRDMQARPALCASGTTALFQTEILKQYVHDSRCYDPFYWEDVEWGVRAWRDDFIVLFCPSALVTHTPRTTIDRFYDEEERERLGTRNRILFDARNRIIREKAAWLMDRIMELPETSRHELAHWRQVAGIVTRRISGMQAKGISEPQPVPKFAKGYPQGKLPGESFCYKLCHRFNRQGHTNRPLVLLVTPFASFPPQHGGARRIAGLMAELAKHFDIVLLSDEASLLDERSFVHFDGLHAVHFVPTEHARSSKTASVVERMRAHCHGSLVSGVEELLQHYRPDIVQIEHAELAELVLLRGPGQRWVLGLHDAYTAADFEDRVQADWFQREVIDRYDAITVCSADDRALVRHPRVVCVPNGTSPPLLGYRPSCDSRLLFMGPFRYDRNYVGIERFLADAYPKVKEHWPDTELVVLGGEGARKRTVEERAFGQPGVEVLDHREDMELQLAACAMTINPLTDIRGSAVKVIESLSAGRICVSTTEGARGLLDANHRALVTVERIEQMVDPILALLKNPDERQRLEMPCESTLGIHHWPKCAEVQRHLYNRLLGSGAPPIAGA